MQQYIRSQNHVHVMHIWLQALLLKKIKKVASNGSGLAKKTTANTQSTNDFINSSGFYLVGQHETRWFSQFVNPNGLWATPSAATTCLEVICGHHTVDIQLLSLHTCSRLPCANMDWRTPLLDARCTSSTRQYCESSANIKTNWWNHWLLFNHPPLHTHHSLGLFPHKVSLDAVESFTLHSTSQCLSSFVIMA